MDNKEKVFVRITANEIKNTPERDMEREYCSPLSDLLAPEDVTDWDDHEDVEMVVVDYVFPPRNSISTSVSWLTASKKSESKNPSIAISEGAEIPSIPCILEDQKLYSKEDRVLEIVVSNEGLPLTMLEQAEAYKRLVGWGWLTKAIADKAGKTENHVKDCLLLGASCQGIRSLVQAGKVSATLAIKMIKEHGEDEALKILLGAVDVAVKEGKKEATAKDTKNATSKAKNKKFNWGKYGPMLYTALESICECPATGKGSERMGDYLVEGNELLQECEDQGYIKG